MKRLITLIAGIAFFTINGAFADDTPTPMVDGYTHEGIISCYGSTCHSRQAATGANVRQNEIIDWQSQDSISGAHSRAYKVLLNEKSRIIARNLGIGDAHKSGECLACHADNVPIEHQGEGFDITEGVGCEACHGGSETWLDAHYAPGRTHEQNLADGLYPTSDPVARAKLCLGCHLGSKNEDQFISHRIMGAGHPRISFELDLFTDLQRHHDEDEDYRERKTYHNGVKVWAVGQAVALDRQLELFSDPKLGREGAFPELVFFDCHACHLTISNDPDWRPTWRSNPDRKLGPGVPVFNDANLIMLKAAVNTVAPELTADVTSAGQRFHRAVSTGGASVSATTSELRELSDELLAQFQKTDFNKKQTIAILQTIVNDSLSRRYTDYAAAEQAVIAVDTFLAALINEKHIERSVVERMQPALDAAYDAVEEPNTYNQTKLNAALRRISSQVNAL